MQTCRCTLGITEEIWLMQNLFEIFNPFFYYLLYSFYSFSGCMTAIALGYENMASQNKLASADAFQQLVRLLRSPKTSEKVLLMVIKVLGILCVGKKCINNVFDVSIYSLCYKCHMSVWLSVVLVDNLMWHSHYFLSQLKTYLILFFLGIE